jgi:hypothetical protein
VTFSAAANSSSLRVGEITIGDRIFTATQAGACVQSINPTVHFLSASAGSAPPISVTAVGCAWIAVANDSWITIGPPGSGTGNGTVTYSVAANTGAVRSGTITIGGLIFDVNQAGSCALSIAPASQAVAASAGPGAQVTVTTSPGCVWGVSTKDPWITLTNPTNGSGSGAFNFTVAANTGPARTGSIAISNLIHSVTQASGCTFSLDSTSATFSSAAQTSGPVRVTTSAGCTWTAASNAPWITVATGATGTGNGTVTFSVAANTTGTSRTGTLTIAGITYTVTQN